MNSTGKTAIITGAGSGIGRATALALLAEGYSVVLAGRRPEALAETAHLAGDERQPGPRRPDRRDRSPSRCTSLFETTRQTFGRLDVLFNNAGTGAPATPIEDLTIEAWRRVVDVNLTGAFLCTREAFRLMKDQVSARRPDHQQRVDLGLCSPAQLGSLHGDQARDHRPHQARRPSTAGNTTSPAARSTSATRKPT